MGRIKRWEQQRVLPMGGHLPLFTPQGPVQFYPKIEFYRVATHKPLGLILFDVLHLSDS